MSDEMMEYNLPTIEDTPEKFKIVKSNFCKFKITNKVSRNTVDNKFSNTSIGHEK